MPLLTHCRSWFAAGLGLVFPPQCASCHAELGINHGPYGLCLDCQAALVITRTPACPQCGCTVPALPADAFRCFECLRHPQRFSAVVRAGRYDQTLRDCILRMKSEHEEPLAAALGVWMAELCGAELAAHRPDLVVPIPLHWRKRLWRGVNSPEVVAAALARRLKAPFSTWRLIRQRDTSPQGTLSRAARQDNVRGAFLVRGARLTGQRVLLVDDVLTTGATAGEAAAVLLRHGAESVIVAALARAEGVR